jgi:hypothetical protein
MTSTNNSILASAIDDSEGHVAIEHDGETDTYYLATEIEAAKSAMRARGISDLPVRRGEGPDEIVTSVRLFAGAEEDVEDPEMAADIDFRECARITAEGGGDLQKVLEGIVRNAEAAGAGVRNFVAADDGFGWLDSKSRDWSRYEEWVAAYNKEFGRLIDEALEG